MKAARTGRAIIRCTKGAKLGVKNKGAACGRAFLLNPAVTIFSAQVLPLVLTPVARLPPGPGSAGPPVFCGLLPLSSEVPPATCVAAPRTPSDRSAGRHRPWRNHSEAAAG